MITDILFDDAKDVGAIRYRLHPLDVGFDLRSEGVAVAIGDEPILRVSCAGETGERRVVEGARDAVIAKLVALGYKIEKGES